MKHAALTQSSFHQPMYPGAADDRYFAGKALEILTALLTGTGAITVMVLLMAIA